MARAVNRNFEVRGRTIAGAVVGAMGIDGDSAFITATYCYRVMYRDERLMLARMA